jgi:hypothetical protein
MKKNVHALAFRTIPLIIVGSFFSCWSPFEPVTHIGQDVVSTIDSNVTNLKAGFKVINGINLAVNGARSVVSPGSDTSIFRLKSGDFTWMYEAGRFGDDTAALYAELQRSQSDLVNFRTACGDTADTIKLLLYYDTIFNDKTISTPFTIKVYSCERKYYPYVGNALTTIDSVSPIAETTVTHAVPDSFLISLGPQMLSRFNRAIADTSATRYVSRIDSIFSNDSTGIHLLKLDTTFIYDTSKKFIGAVSVQVSGGGILRFARPPEFQVVNRTTCADTVFNRNTMVAAYYDVCVSEVNAIPSDSLMTSWQANRYIEMPITLAPLWDSASFSGGQFKIIQAASCSLYTSNSLFEQISPIDTIDTIRTIVYGLLDHQITDAKFHSQGTFDSLNNFLNKGRVVLDTVRRGSTGLRLSMTMFLQSLADQNPRPPKAYLYIFTRPVARFSRIVFNKVTSVKFSALFSNPHQ